LGVECGANRESYLEGTRVSPGDLQRYQELLLRKQRELSCAKPEDETPVPQAGGWRGDIIDQANADAEAELQIRLHQTDGHLLQVIEEALARMRNGIYGICVVCHRPIAKARLEAVPWTRHCRDCKDQQRAAA
jgi:RNA polymerase-binding protein DksA